MDGHGFFTPGQTQKKFLTAEDAEGRRGTQRRTVPSCPFLQTVDQPHNTITHAQRIEIEQIAEFLIA
jgi:hypothetical protein